jgi:hypothetical protein
VLFPHLRFRLWVMLVTVALCAGVMAEVSQRRARLARLCVAHHEQADACFDRIGRVCKLGETPASIEASYRRQGPQALRGYQVALRHLVLAKEYEEAANRRWLPVLSHLPPLHGFRDIRGLTEWGLEALLEFGPLVALGLLFQIIRLDLSHSRRKR